MRVNVRQMKNRILGRWMTMSLQQKLTAVFVLTAVMILAVNLYMYAIINGMTGGLALNCTLLHGPWQLAFIDILLIVVGLLFLFIGYHKTTFPWKNNLDCQ